MNQENNNEQNNGIPNIFRSPIHNQENNSEEETGTSVPTPENQLDLMDSIPVFDIPNFNSVPQNIEPSEITTASNSNLVSHEQPVTPVNPNVVGQQNNQSTPVMLNQQSATPEIVEPQPAIINHIGEAPSMPMGNEIPDIYTAPSTPVSNPSHTEEVSAKSVVDIQADTIPNVTPTNISSSTPVSSIEEVEELNPWVAAVEAEKEEQVVMPQEPKEPVPVKPMAPHTVEDLIAAEAPIASEPEKKNKKIPWKFFAIVGGIIAAIILIVIVVAILNKAGNKTLSCSLADTNGGIEYRSTNTFVFKGKNMSTLGTKVEYKAVDSADHATEMSTMKSVVQFMDEKVKKFSGTKTVLQATDKSISYDITLEHDKVKKEEWAQDDNMFVEVTALEYYDKDYNAIKKEMTELGYTCK